MLQIVNNFDVAEIKKTIADFVHTESFHGLCDNFDSNSEIFSMDSDYEKKDDIYIKMSLLVYTVLWVISTVFIIWEISPIAIQWYPTTRVEKAAFIVIMGGITAIIFLVLYLFFNFLQNEKYTKQLRVYTLDKLSKIKDNSIAINDYQELATLIDFLIKHCSRNISEYYHLLERVKGNLQNYIWITNIIQNNIITDTQEHIRIVEIQEDINKPLPNIYVTYERSNGDVEKHYIPGLIDEVVENMNIETSHLICSNEKVILKVPYKKET